MRVLLDELRANGRFLAVLNAADVDGATPLFAACQNGHVQVVGIICSAATRASQFVKLDKPNLQGATPVRRYVSLLSTITDLPSERMRNV